MPATAPRLIETARLRLAPPAAVDADGIFAYASDPDVTRYMGWPRHGVMADTDAFLAFAGAQWKKNGVGPYVIRARDDGRLLGCAGIDPEPVSRASVGYVLAKDAWGYGFAAEALDAMVEVARLLGVADLDALCHPDHRRSQRVLEKCGFERDYGTITQLVFPNIDPDRAHEVARYVRAV